MGRSSFDHSKDHDEPIRVALPLGHRSSYRRDRVSGHNKKSPYWWACRCSVGSCQMHNDNGTWCKGSKDCAETKHCRRLSVDLKDDKCSQLAFRPKPHSTISSEAYVNHLALRSAPHTRVRCSSNRRYGVLLYRVYRIMSLALTGCMRASAGLNCRTIAPFCRKDDERYAAITLVRGEAMMSTMTRKQVNAPPATLLRQLGELGGALANLGDHSTHVQMPTQADSNNLGSLPPA